MLVKSIWLQNFRNHENRVVEFDPKLTLLVGANGSGKTNILEGIYLLATGGSMRADKQEEMIRWGAELARVKGIVVHRISKSQITNYQLEEELFGHVAENDRSEGEFFEDKIELEVLVTRGVLQGKAVPRKKYMVNGLSRQLKSFVGNLRVVLFAPEDLNLIEGSPARRRKYLDEVLCQVDREYRAALLAYEKGVYRRNKLLLDIRERTVPRSQLFFWDQLLIKNGAILTAGRQRLVDFLNFEFDGWSASEKLQIVYDSSGISPARLAQYAHEEVAAGRTLVGPHRDDFELKFQSTNHKLHKQEVDLKTFGSRGQQRMGVLWLKLGEVAFVEKECKERPVLLLDDIMSELDEQHQEMVWDLVGKQQTVMTTAEELTKGELVGTPVNLDKG